MFRNRYRNGSLSNIYSNSISAILFISYFIVLHFSLPLFYDWFYDRDDECVFLCECIFISAARKVSLYSDTIKASYPALS